MAYRKTRHPGVTLTRNRHGTFVMRWKDYDAQVTREQSLDPNKYRSKASALPLLKMKSKEVLEQKHLVNMRGRLPNIGADLGEAELEYLKDFQANRGDQAAERTRKNWLCRWRAYCEQARLTSGADVSQEHLRRFRNSLADGLAPPTRNRHLGAVKAFLSWAKRNGYLRLSKDDIADQLAQFHEAKKRPRVLSRDEMVALIAAVVKHDSARHFAGRLDKQAYHSGIPTMVGKAKYPPLAPFVFLALLTGARPSEVLAIRWDHVRFEANEIEIWGNKTKCERAVPLHDSPVLVRLLKGLRKASGGDLHVCGDWVGGKPREINDRQWKRLKKLLDPSFHVRLKDFRSTTVAFVASASDDSEYLLKERFGHGERVSKKHYRRPLHGLRERGATVEQWLGVANELLLAMSVLRLLDEPFIRRQRKKVQHAS